METSTAENLFGQVATTTGDIIQASLPLLWIFLGFLIALMVFAMIIKGFRYLRRGIKGR
jgi:type II secretory pathway component PulF